MKPDWKELCFDLVAIKDAIESFRIANTELSSFEAENLLAAARDCTMELIALRSALQARTPKIRSDKGS